MGTNLAIPHADRAQAARPDKPARSRRSEVLVATLGLRPAVITTALDLLVADGRIIDEAVVVHTDPPAAADGIKPDALAALRAAFPDNAVYLHPRRTLPCRLRTVAPMFQDVPIPDVATRDEAHAAYQTLYRTVRECKQQGMIVHLCIAGGRKSLSIFAMAVAQLLFDGDDRLWHIIGSPEYTRSGLLHPRSRHDATLVYIPVLALGLCHLGSVASLMVADDPIVAVEAQRRTIQRERRALCQQFLDDVLTVEERRLVLYVLRNVVEHHKSPTYKDIARELVLAPSVVGNRFSDVYDKMATFFGLSEATTDNRLLVGVLAPHYQHIAA